MFKLLGFSQRAMTSHIAGASAGAGMGGGRCP